MKIIMCSKEAADKRAEASRAALSFGFVDEQEESLSHGIVLCTQEQYEDYLMHYRRGGEKKGVRRWQNEDGSLTPEGYKHYAEMYGWGKKLKKAEKLQEKADKAADKADKASRKADDDYVKAHNANRKNERRGTERSQEKADAANDRADLSKENAEFKSVKARQAQRKASDYADKLQRKEDKMSKYVDENGDLNEKALNKYTYATGVLGERKMSLVGRLKFGNEYADKFNERYKNKMTKEETKAWEEDEKKKFDEESSEEYRQIKRARTMEELDTVHNEVMSDFENRSDADKKKLGDRVLKSLDDASKAGLGDGDDKTNWEGLQNWLMDRVYEKSGSMNSMDYKRGTNAEKAEAKVRDAYKQLSDREDQIAKEHGLSRNSSKEKERKRLEALLKNDSIWKKLDSDFNRVNDDVAGAILKDIGFSDTPANRSLLWAYGWFD